MDRSRLPQLAIFATVAESGGFRGAARELGIAPSAVSHAISSLEQSLGVRLLARTTRSVAVTEEGALLLKRLRPALGEIDLALDAVREANNRVAGNLRLSVPPFAAHWLLAPRLAAFSANYPGVTLELRVEEKFNDIVATGVDAGMRLGESLEPDMIAVPMSSPIRASIVAAPAYLEKHGVPRHPRDLLDHLCIRRRFASGQVYRWEFEKDGEAIVLDVSGPLILGDDRLVVEAAVGGAGIAFLLHHMAPQAIAKGDLISMLEDWCAPFPGVYLYYPSRRQMRPALRAFIDFFKFTP
ncbi:LysR family transcriptional regulator [Phyllobacterium endophyticum]|uniref:LysR family transcriptional regulator n=1 Tax=Phyllobacterium endophyticum TaxID=1149773 RepID=A0A2P7AZC5_9HYPH|nr:LysR family transcriptional regulator [Phyllobacterium endophyticum]MBB3235858.1 DNA-binding transcriptional LysR family regulator [Phyllobacterium endophyticum]PSH59551.1 LysR family transcriptional regulator [Phyllobacterium endophyticum]TYR41689.1 LysR family transcriptional regulator [Phyllobacterium endophyticum]